MNGSNTYTGSTTISGGTLQIGNDGTTGNLSTSSSITNNGDLVFRRSNEISQGTDFANAISGSGNLTQNGSGNLILASGNTYNGVTTLNSGTLSFDNIANGGEASAIGQSSSTAGNLVLNGGVLRYTGNNATTNRGFTVGGSASINVTTAGRTLNFSGSTAGGGTLTKVGTGTLELSGGFVAHAATTVNAGTLLVSGNLSNGVTVNSGGILAGIGTVGGLTTLNSGAILTPGNGVGTINLTGGLTVNSGAEIQMTMTNGSSFDTVNLGAGAFTLSGGNLTITIGSTLSEGSYALFSKGATGAFTFISLTGVGATSDVSFNPSTGNLTVIPEPGTLALFGIGASFLLWRVRRRQRAQR